MDITIPQDELYDTYLGVVAAIRDMSAESIRDLADNPALYGLSYLAHVKYTDPDRLREWNILFANNTNIALADFPYDLSEGILLPNLDRSQAALEEVEVVVGIDGLYSLGEGYVWLWSK